MSDWTPHADAVVRAVPEDEAIQAVREALEKRYRALVARLREAGDETWADNLSGYNSYRMEPAKCSLAVLEMMAEEIHQLRGRSIAIDAAMEHARRTGEPIAFVQSSALAEAETREENERLRKIAREASEDVANFRRALTSAVQAGMQMEDDALKAERERDQLKEVNDRMAADRERLIAERDVARQDRDEWKALHGSAVYEMQARLDRQERANAVLRSAYEHACAERDTYRDLAKDLYDDEPCSFDHHGGCQAHGWLEPEPGEECPDGRAQRLFEEEDDNDASE